MRKYVSVLVLLVTLIPWVVSAAVIPTVTTHSVTSIGTITATGSGTITDTGGEVCDKRGVCWNTTGSPTIADSIAYDGGSYETCTYTKDMTGLTPGTLYYVRAYAHNSAGYGYGSDVTFTTAISSDVLSTDIYGIPPVTDNPDLFYESGEGTYPGSGLPMAPFIHDQCNTMGISINIFWILLALGLSISVGIMTFVMTAGNELACAIAPGVVWGMFAALAGGLVPLWTVIVYAVIAIAFMVGTRTASL